MGAIKYLLALLLILIPATSIADTHNAASCSSADVTSAITASADGDIVTIPPRDCSGTPWTTGVTIPSGKNITIQGAGYTNTIIAHSGCDAFNLNGTASRLTGVQIKHIPDTTGYGVVAFKTGWRIDHCYLNRNDDRDAGAVLTYEYIAIATYKTGTGLQADPITGLIDNNIIHGRIVLNGLNSTPAATEWTQASHIGTENAVYVEDNVFNRIDCDHSNVLDSNRGISYVARYNTITGHTQFMAHGTMLNTRGTRNWEIYGNNFVADKAVWMPPFTVMGGSGIVAFNTSNANYQYGTTAHIYPYVMSGCTGDYPCTDQVGRGQNQILDPAYWFSNFVGTSRWTRYGTVSHIQEGRDYYIQGSSFDGTSGVGCGTLAALQGAAYYTSCTTGVGYWATDQSCSDITSFVGASTDVTGGERTKSSVISGTLYKCNATGDGWDSHYTPSAYPHTLREDAGTDETAPTLVSATIAANGTSLSLVFSENVTVNTNTGFVLTATGSPSLTYASGTGTATLIYTIGAAVAQSESGITLAYTTGANYIEDAAGNDLGSFTGTAVVNHSTQNTPPTVELTVTKTGSGCTVTSAPSGVNCGSTCTLSVDNGTVVTLSGWSENGWNAITYGGDCASNGTVTLDDGKECTATCTQVQLFP